MSLRIEDGGDELSEINVTPFIDVMLVLLIVFMVAAPLSTVDVHVSLPGSSAPPADRPAEPVWLTVSADRVIYLANEPVGAAEIAAALDTLTRSDRKVPIFLRADQGLEYGALMGILDALRAGGYLNVALVGLESSP